MFPAGWLATCLSFSLAPVVCGAAATSISAAPLTSVGSGKTGFTLTSPTNTGILFTNILRGESFLTNAVAHNGAGLAIGDVDGDGWPDIYFCNLEGPNQLYRNRGNWRFEAMQIGDAACAGQLSTGAVLADVDGDADLDLIVNGIASGTRLFVNDGAGRWAEAKDSGLSRTSSPTSMALADIDQDGDLDLYCAHYIDVMHLADPTTRFALERRGDEWVVSKVNGESTRQPKWKDRFVALPGGSVRELPEVHGLYRNDGTGHFSAIQNEPGVFLNEQGNSVPPFRDWGLAVAFRDLNGDGAPDIYVCNDNVSPDRIWINQGRGTFRAMSATKIRHTSRSSMGVDFADLDRDGTDDFIVVDMLAREHQKQITQLVKDFPGRAEIENTTARPAFNRNTLFFGRKDGSYAEYALMAGLTSSDWSWCPIFVDVDLDGYEDLLVSNGFEFDVMDQDSNTAIRTRRLSAHEQKRSRALHPSWRTRNASFRNRGDGTFEAMNHDWGFDQPGVSYGMALGDLDRDGDYDVVINNLNDAASVLRNDSAAPRISIQLKGRRPNTSGIGARIQLSGATVPQSQEMISGGRYMSGDQAIRVFAADRGKAHRLEVRWPDGTQTIVTNLQADHAYKVEQNSTTPAMPLAQTNAAPYFSDISDLLGHVHAESEFDDWALQPMLPQRLSRLGPGISWFDIDGDGWEDLLIGAGRGGKLAIFKNLEGKGFRALEIELTAKSDQTGIVGWHDGTGKRQVLVGTSNLENPRGTKSEISILSSDGALVATRSESNAAIGPLAIADIDQDGDLDVFAGGNFRPGAYPEPVSSALWLNENGELKSAAAFNHVFESIGLISGATFADLDNDGDADLALALQWGSIRVYYNEGTQFRDATRELNLEGFPGFWSSIVAGDFNSDGKVDLAAGNVGRNTYYQLHGPTTFRIVYGDWDGNGIFENVEAWQSGTEWFPLRDRSTLAQGWPEVLRKFPTHVAYAAAPVGEILGTNFARSRTVEMRYPDSTVFINRQGRFDSVPLPREAQLSPVFSMNVGDFNSDGKEDLFLAQNFFGRKYEISRDDAGRGLWLEGDGNGSFTAVDATISGIDIPGEQRGAALADFNHDGRVDLVVSQNGARTKLFLNQGAPRGLRVTLRGVQSNPDAIGAQIRILNADGTLGPCRTVQAGSGFWSQDAAIQVLGRPSTARQLWIRWPNRAEAKVDLGADVWDLVVDQPK